MQEERSVKVYIPEPWPVGRCRVCGFEKEIVATAVREDGTHGVCCEDCWQQLEKPPHNA